MLNTPIKPPFPSWVTKCDPIASSWENNGFFQAFEARRQRRVGWLGMFSPKLYHLMKGWLGLLIPMLIASITYYFFPTQKTIICFMFLGTVYSLLRIFLTVPLKKPTGLPLEIKTLLSSEKKRKQLDQIRLIPENEGSSLGEAILLETISRLWFVYTVIYWCIVFILTFILNNYYLQHFSLHMKIPILQIISQAALSLGGFVGAYYLKPLFSSKTNEYIAKQVLSDYRAMELKGAGNAVASGLSTFLTYLFFAPVLVIILAFEITAVGLFVLFLLQWVMGLTSLSALHQTVAIQGILAVLLASPCLYSHIIYNKLLESKTNQYTAICKEIREQVFRVIQKQSEQPTE